MGLTSKVWEFQCAECEAQCTRDVKGKLLLPDIDGELCPGCYRKLADQPKEETEQDIATVYGESLETDDQDTPVNVKLQNTVDTGVKLALGFLIFHFFAGIVIGIIIVATMI